ncbi:TPA: NAD(P)-dependent alcohol dehydrogenase [Escherichia coli]|uniref:NAD(P)-dependent alcohol dehydrogenase n=1 Tax=Escherichia coli TaxID=562 RepID=UPI000F9259C7|nr:NAD(P)-dependent alcohol dehydrogenase [Escherichia coli]EMA3115640.1 NAD(P)-dependent alcohol dehydrogenase [Salmonella enterica]HBQ4000310.1 NAD(P)-dependent alcohol dehydrogenase [Klebsiella pneumoniae]EED0306191.1 NAD(P)-dependent alcohol dehydrogenase [Escherichia coli]EEU3019673.1 NAD(P)-dependent alcohol dehydrogenase [Escherichia coli]EEX5925953.1 NAD(P)-dependent alcohol dehydrogenase [Escherichia coli]
MIKTVKAIGTDAATHPLKEFSIKRRGLLNDDVEIEILYCGICHSDLHQIKNDFGGTHYPVVPGHEIVGRVIAVGENVTRFKPGDFAAVGCIVDSCGECPACRHDLEQFCESGTTLSFNTPDKHLGGMTYGGFSQTYVCRESYTLKMPDNLDLAAAAPLLCAGITVYSPLKHWQAGAGKVVGILGIGGLGHVAIKIAKAMGAHVVVFTTSQAKVEDANRLGAHEAVLSSDAQQMAKFAGKLDLILDTVSAKHDVNAYLKLLKIDGSVVLVGLPPEPIEISAFNVVKGRRSFSGSNIGGIAETQEMLDFCAEHNITADIELIDASQINDAFSRLEQGDVKYRFVVDMTTLK